MLAARHPGHATQDRTRQRQRRSCVWRSAGSGVRSRLLATALSAFALVSIVATGATAHSFNPLDYGAKGDGAHNDTQGVQAALDAAGTAGGGVVILSSPRAFLCGSLLLRSHVVLRIEPGATLLGSPTHTDYPVAYKGSAAGVKARALLTSGLCLEPDIASSNCTKWDHVQNVTIDGGGTINGQGWNWWFEPPDPGNNRMDMIEPLHIDGFTLRDVTVRASPQWSVHPVACSNVHVDNITLLSDVSWNDRDYQGHNVDGVDPDSCVNVTIENSVIRAGDDCIAIYSLAPEFGATVNVTVRNVTCYTPLTVTHGFDTHDVTFENCTVLGAWGSGTDPWYRPQWWHTAIRIKTGSAHGATGGTVHDIRYRDIKVENVHLVADFQQYYPCQNASGLVNYRWCRSQEPEPADMLPSWYNIHFDGIYGTAWRAAWLNCLPQAPCRNVTFTDVQLGPLTNPPGQFDTVAPYMCENVYGSAAGGGNLPSADDCVKGGVGPVGTDGMPEPQLLTGEL